MESRGEEDSSSCIICLNSVQRVDAVWSCQQCYCVFHLSCIQAWAKDCVSSNRGPLSRELFPDQITLWSCPKCRKDYTPSSIPTRYLCFCGKKVCLSGHTHFSVRRCGITACQSRSHTSSDVSLTHTQVDPPADPWLEPHSCGEVCGRSGSCKHTCSSLCHPGTSIHAHAAHTHTCTHIPHTHTHAHTCTHCVRSLSSMSQDCVDELLLWEEFSSSQTLRCEGVDVWEGVWTFIVMWVTYL